MTYHGAIVIKTCHVRKKDKLINEKLLRVQGMTQILWYTIFYKHTKQSGVKLKSFQIMILIN